MDMFVHSQNSIVLLTKTLQCELYLCTVTYFSSMYYTITVFPFHVVHSTAQNNCDVMALQHMTKVFANGPMLFDMFMSLVVVPV